MSDMNINNIGLVLTVVALALAVWQTWAANRQARALLLISNALSTKYLGTFPEYMPYVGNLIERAKRELLIICTMPTHGVFSVHEMWLSMKHAIEMALLPDHKVMVSCVFANAATRRTFLEAQFRVAKADWSTWRSNPANASRLQYFLKKFGRGGDIQELTFDGFLNLFDSAANEEFTTTYKGAEVLEVNYRPPLYMWVVDGKEAIFGISTTTPSYIAEAFWTADARLINALINMHRDCRQWAQRHGSVSGESS